MSLTRKFELLRVETFLFRKSAGLIPDALGPDSRHAGYSHTEVFFSNLSFAAISRLDYYYSLI